MKIIDINKYTKKREKREMFTTIKNEVRNKGQNGTVFTLQEVSGYAKKILETATYYNQVSTPINRIAEDFGIIPYRTYNLQESISGVIYSGGTTRKIYGTDNVILVDKAAPEKHQRFVIAHEIGHYLFDCITNAKYNDDRILFAETYPKKDHDSEKELKADRFAAELLMPSDLFIKQYNIAMEEKHNYMFTLIYLSEFFGTKISSIEKRISEVF